MRNQLAVLILCTLAGLYACNDDGIVSTVDPDIQLEIDLEVIADYIADHGFEQVDTTVSGVRYVVLDSGSGPGIELNDIVSFHMVGRLTDGFLFATNLDTADINNGTYDSALFYRPIRYTYTPDGWNIPELVSNYGSLESGYREGLSKVMGILRIGGRARLIVPSGLAYASSPPFGFGIPKNAVLVFDIYPTYVR